MADDRLAGPLGQAEAAGGGNRDALTQRFVGPVKRSITIAGHPTSISLEPVFWAALEAAARARALPLSALVARIDARRVEQADAPNLASVLRSWLMIEIANHSQQA